MKRAHGVFLLLLLLLLLFIYIFVHLLFFYFFLFFHSARDKLFLIKNVFDNLF